MKVIRKSCAQGAREAEGLAVIIDVFRAFSCEPLFFYFGARRVIMEADPAKAVSLKNEHPEFVLSGEVNEVPIEGADLGNSPTHIIQKGFPYFENKTVIHRTTAGVTGATAAFRKAEEVVLGSFVMAKAIAGYIKEKRPDRVSLVAMGERAERPAPEDEACADYLEHLLIGTPYDPVQSFRDVVFQPTAQKFLSGTRDYLPREDPIFCLQKDLFDLVLTVRTVDHRLEVSARWRNGTGSFSPAAR
ncbi:MAG: 2-phosphosulfolactate phosphatase [Deltaproteobacteria bacterium]|nr:2-phosphosulfolactate phosphatase [Deltaproteobacteria bacterium]